MSDPILEPPPVSAADIPHRTQIPFVQKWRSFGTGIGIEIGIDNMMVTLAVVRPNGIRVADTLEIARYRERPAAEWGADYQAFLKKHKTTHVSAAVVLPAGDCVSRVVSLPGVASRELEAAVQYQLDGLNPYPEEEAIHSFSRLAAPQQASVAVGISRRPVIEDYATIFDEAGVAVMSFLTPAAAIYSAMRVLQLAPAPQYLAVNEEEAGTLVYGESETHPLYCVRFPAASDRAVSLASAQMRLSDDAPRGKLAALLPTAGMDQATGPIAYAASLVSALSSQALTVNLLPVDRRKTNSPLRWVPTIVLVVLLMLLGLGFSYYQEYENRRLLQKLDSEIAKLQPKLATVRTTDTEIEAARKKLEYLNGLAGNPRLDLDALRELTRILPMSAYLARMDLTRTEVSISGEIDQSLELLRMLDNSSFFKDSEFAFTPNRTPNGKEAFQVRAKRENPYLQPPGQPRAVAPGPVVGGAVPPPGLIPGLPPGAVVNPNSPQQGIRP